MAKSINWLNEKGNVSVKVREGVRAQVKAKALSVMAEGFEGAVANANGGISVPVGIVVGTDEVIYAHFDMTVNTKLPTEKTERKKSAKKAEKVEVEVPDLFGADGDKE